MPTPSDAIVFFGATGDLAYKKIFPSLHSMIKHGLLNMPVIGVAKAGWTLEQLKARARDSINEHGGGVDPGAFDKLVSLLRYVDGDYRDVTTFQQLRKELGCCGHPLHYLAIPPSMFATVAEGLAKTGCNAGSRIVVEKPFGRDLRSARELNATLHKYFDESAIFRIDHYLGKEPVQNLIYFRFANTLMEPSWNRNYIHHIEITMAENFGVQGRGKFYEEAGAIRDVLQNHMLQLVACLAMDPPTDDSGEPMRDERSRLLRSIRSLTPADVIRGQFTGYRNEADVAKDSTVETFAAVRFWIENWRWADVPFYVRVGKLMPASVTEIIVEFRQPPHNLFPEARPLPPNRIRFTLSPEVIIAVGSRSKAPGEGMHGRYIELIAKHEPKDEMEPYERLLMEAARGESTYFARQDAVEESWRIVDPVLGNATPLHFYQPNTWGPPEADAFIAPHGTWDDPRNEQTVFAD